MRKSHIYIGLGILLLFVIFRKELVFKPYHLLQGMSVKVPTLKISISDDEMAKIESMRNAAIAHGIGSNEHKEYVKGSIKWGDEEYKVKLRLKGDHLDHYKTNIPSFRVKTKNDEVIMGSDVFSLQNTGARSDLKEWVYLKMLEEADVLSLHMDVVKVCLKRECVIYAYEEHFTPHLIRRFYRPEGPIVYITEDLFWEKMAEAGGIPKDLEEEIYLKSPIGHYNNTALENDSSALAMAEQLLEDYRQGHKTTSEVFDIEKMAYQYAVCDLLNTHHALRWHNHRYYYNPSSEKLEPIGFDGSAKPLISDFAINDAWLMSSFHQNLFKDKKFSERYLKNLKVIGNGAFLDDFFERHDTTLKELTKRIYKMNPYFKDHFEDFYQNAAWISSHIDELEAQLSALVVNTDS